MRTDTHGFLVEVYELCEAEDLESAAVRQDRSVPTHELGEAPELSDHIHTRPKVKVVGVGEHDLGTEASQLLWRDPLHRTDRADGHECGRLHGSACGHDAARPSSARRVSLKRLEAERARGHVISMESP